MAKRTENRQIEILKFIHTRVTEKGYPPTVREIGEAVQLSSTSTVHGHLSRLEKKGLILRDPTKPRAIELTASGLEKIDVQPASIPMLGVVTAGEPILAVEDASDFFPIPPDLANSTGSLFMLTIRGESMINAGILDGDMLLVESTSVVSNGDMAVALVDESATVKTFYKEEGIYRLQPENDTMEPIIVSEVEILGKVIGVFRFFE